MFEKKSEAAVEKKQSIPQCTLYGLQHVFVSNVWLDPVFVAAMIGLPFALAANMVNAIFIAAGLVTFVQATRLVKLPVVQGPSAAFDALLISAGKAHHLPQAQAAMLVSALAVFFLAITGLLGKIKGLFTPLVSGTVLFIVGIALSGFALTLFFGGTAGEPTFLHPEIVTISSVTALVVVVFSVYGKGLWRSYSFLLALVVGNLLAFLFGRLDFSRVANAAWFGLPDILPYGPLAWNGEIVLTFSIAYLVALVEAIGVYRAAAEAADVSLDDRKIRYGFAGEAGGSAISVFVGGFPTTAYGQNAALLRLTGVTSRHAVKAAAFIFLILGFVPKAGALLAATPHAVVGGLFLPAAASLLWTGIQLLEKMERTEANGMALGLALLCGLVLPDVFADVPGIFGVLFGNSVLAGAVSVIVLQILFFVPEKIEMFISERRGASESEFRQMGR